MMNTKVILSSLYRRIYDYNVFIPDEDDYDDEQQDPAVILKHQKYSTRLYILLLIFCMYVLFYTTMMKPQARTIVITDINSDQFEKLYSQHGDLLSCPCSTIKTSYKTFLSNTIQFHPVCTSYFVTQQWIEDLYIATRSSYGILDFRTTAASQFQLLSSLCKLSKSVTAESEIDLNNNELVTVFTLPESKIEIEVNAVVDLFKNSLSIQIMSFINYFRIVTQTNNFITALNTNALIYQVDSNEIFFSLFIEHYLVPKSKALFEKSISCGIIHSTGSTTFDSVFDMPAIEYHMDWYSPESNSTLVNGFYTGCSPLEALLRSTLDCLYDINCLQLLTQYFPSLIQTNWNFTDHVLVANKTNLTVYDHLTNMFVDDWITTFNYSAYFLSCNPSRCTYTTTDKINYSYAIALFISLYGGLIMVLRLIAPLIIKTIWKLKHRRTNRISLVISIETCKAYLQQLNLFKKADKRTGNDIKEQKIITRVYLILLMTTIITLLLFNSLDTQTITRTVSNPSLITYVDLQKSYSHTLRCPCSTMIIPYYKFMEFSPIFHEICLSDLTSNKWLEILMESATLSDETDWRNRAYLQFNLLSKLCQLANETINSAINKLLLQSFVVSNMLTENDFNLQIKKILDQFYESTIVYFGHLIDVVDVHTQINQPYIIKYAYRSMSATFSSMEIVTSNTDNNKQIAKLTMASISLQDIYTKTVSCICSSSVKCQVPSAIFDVDLTVTHDPSPNYTVLYVMPGSLVGCSEIDSLLLSTLECFYSDSSCFPILMNYIKETYLWYVEDPAWFDIQPLRKNSSTFTRFDRNSSISTIVKEIMLEQWNPSYSYETFYQLCSPSYCLYSEKIYANNIITVGMILLSMIGGLAISLRVITPHMITILMTSFSVITRKQEERQHQVDLNWYDKLKLMKQKIIRTLYDVIINLNIFSLRTFGSNVDRLTAKRLGQQTTRLYILLLILSFLLLTLYTITRRQILTDNFNTPSFDTYRQLTKKYREKLTCSCSSIASTYDHFIHIQRTFHPICSSHFVSDTIISNLSVGISVNLSIYESRDYRRFILLHLQYLTQLCDISIQSVNSSINQLLSTLFISKELLSQQNFDEHIESLIAQTKGNAPHSLNSIFFLIRSINFGNAIISTHGTNFRYTVPWANIESTYLNTEAEIYDNNCSCGLQMNCSSQAYFIDNNLSHEVSLKGLRIGCTPTESLLSSTLECFYDQSCIDTIKEYTNYSHVLQSLSLTDRLNINNTIGELVENLFIHEWIASKNYSSYYQECSPSLCSYSYVQQFSIIYIISFILGLQGGLTIVLHWICPRIVQFVMRIKKGRKKRSNIIHSNNRLETITTNVENKITSKIENSRSRLLKIMLLCGLVMVLIVALTVFSIFSIQHENNPITTTVSSMMASKEINTTIALTSSTRKISICKRIFEKTTIYTYYTINTFSIVIGDFNNDQRLDIGFGTEIHGDSSNYYRSTYKIVILLGNGNGTFIEQTSSLMGNWISYGKIIAAYFNDDDVLDIGFENGGDETFDILIGNGNGTFDKQTSLSLKPMFGVRDISVNDVNSDGYIDIIFGSSNLDGFLVYYGSENGTFIEKSFSDNGYVYTYQSFLISDLNNDNFTDILFVNRTYRTIVVYLGHGNGSFDTKRVSFAGGGIDPSYFAIGDFNEDKIPDVIITYALPKTLGLFFGYGNGSFADKIILNLFTYSFGSSFPHITIIDLNDDDHLDIVVCLSDPYFIAILYGDGNGSFEQHKLFPTDGSFQCSFISTGDINGDHYPDIIVPSDYAVDIFLNTGQCEDKSETFETSTTIYP